MIQQQQNSTPNPEINISDYNSIRFVKEIQWDNTRNPKTIENTLSFEEDGVNEKGFVQLFQRNDSVRIQIKSNCESIIANVHSCCDDMVAPLFPIKKTKYMGIVDQRSASGITHEGYLTIFFINGQTYDPDTGLMIETYNLNQYVPKWIKAGTIISANDVQVIVSEIIWLEEFQAYALKTNMLSSINGIDQIMVRSVYNKFDYEIWEIDMSFSCLKECKYQIRIVGDLGVKSVEYKSEIIHIKEKHENTHLIIYSNSKNTQINYSFGIQHLLRVPYENTLKFNPEGEHTVHKTDQNSYLLKSSTYETFEIELSPLPTGMIEKLTLAFSCDELFVDTVAYVTDSKPSIERLGSSNLYDLKQKLTLADREYVNKSNKFYKRICPPKASLNIGEGLLIIADSGVLFVE